MSAPTDKEGGGAGAAGAGGMRGSIERRKFAGRRRRLFWRVFLRGEVAGGPLDIALSCNPARRGFDLSG